MTILQKRSKNLIETSQRTKNSIFNPRFIEIENKNYPPSTFQKPKVIQR